MIKETVLYIYVIMSIINPKVSSCFLVCIFLLLTGAGELCLLYFSLKYLIVLHAYITEALLCAALLANTIYSIYSKVITFISEGTIPSKLSSTLLFFISVGLSVTFCVIYKLESLDVIAVIFGNLLQLVCITLEVERLSRTKVYDISIIPV
jgi:hypothetical protein